jgi:hypothetical protein
MIFEDLESSQHVIEGDEEFQVINMSESDVTSECVTVVQVKSFQFGEQDDTSENSNNESV